MQRLEELPAKSKLGWPNRTRLSFMENKSDVGSCSYGKLTVVPGVLDKSVKNLCSFSGCFENPLSDGKVMYSRGVIHLIYMQKDSFF